MNKWMPFVKTRTTPCRIVGEPNTAFAQYSVGQSYLAPLTMEQIPTFHVTFEPGCRNHWHIHHVDKGGRTQWCEPVDDEWYGKLT